jgi:hypothetical protein
MAVFTDIGGLNMCRGLSGCVGAIVAAEAVTGEVGMINIRRDPARGCVTVVASVAAGYMRRILAFGDRAIVAGSTGTDHLCVVYPVCRREELTVVTVFTNVGRLDMCRTLADRSDTVVA